MAGTIVCLIGVSLYKLFFQHIGESTIILLFVLALFIIERLIRFSIKYFVTNKRVYIKTGIIFQEIDCVDIADIANVTVISSDIVISSMSSTTNHIILKNIWNTQKVLDVIDAQGGCKQGKSSICESVE